MQDLSEIQEALADSNSDELFNSLLELAMNFMAASDERADRMEKMMDRAVKALEVIANRTGT